MTAITDDRVLFDYTVGRWSENELILFVEKQQESWILYPPRSAYAFLALRRPSRQVTLVEQHPWAPFSKPTDHLVLPERGCTDHGLECGAAVAIKVAANLGFDPFR
jgi:hypothetical protein